jgi:hypothetical protein
MSIGITWYTIEDAAAKYNLDKSLILKWVQEGLVRSEESDQKIVLINIDDIELEVQERVRSFKE